MKTNILLVLRWTNVFATDRRDSTEIAYELLTLIKRGFSKKQMVQEANLNFRLANRHTMQLVEMGLIQKDSSSHLADKYRLTSKGEKVLKILSQLEIELDPSRHLGKTSDYPRQGSDPGAFRPEEPKDYSRIHQELPRKNWVNKVRPFINYVLVVLAGLGLGYLLP